MVDTVIWHWVVLFTGEEVEPESFGRAVQWLAESFYVGNGLLVSPCPSHLQVVLNFLVGLFGQIVMQTNVTKIVRMVCQQCQMSTRKS